MSSLYLSLLCVITIVSVATALVGQRSDSLVRSTSLRHSLPVGSGIDIRTSTTTISAYKELKVETLKGISFKDITKDVREVVKSANIREGQVTILSRHTTSAITINEMESRLVDDARQFLLKLVPAAYPYLHNDLHLRSGPPGWPGGDEAWRAQEPVNCHSHLIAMLLGASECVPIYNGELCIGTWQSIIVAELDGPRTRSISIQATGI